MVKKVGMGRRATKSRAAPRLESWDDFLESGENLLWQGAPARGLRFSGKGLLLSLFGLVFLSFSVFWVGMASFMTAGEPMGMLFPLFGAPFVLVGLWLVVGHWIYDAYKRKRTRYALTTKRALIARTVLGRKMESYPISKDTQITLVSGTLDTVNFAERVYRNKDGDNVVPIGFRFIEDGQKVYNLLRDVRENNR